MKTIKLAKVMAVVALLAVGGQASAQGFLKKLKKTTEKVTETVNTVTGNETTEATGTDTTVVKKINWEALPVYKAQQVYELTAEGDTVKNDDGTAHFIVILVDQFGNRRTPETVKAQQKKVNDAIAKIGESRRWCFGRRTCQRRQGGIGRCWSRCFSQCQ